MRFHSLFVAVPLVGLAGCYQFEVTAQVAYAQMSLDGDLGYATAGSSTPAVAQDLESGFGLGDDQGTPYARVMIDTGVPVLGGTGIPELGRTVGDARVPRRVTPFADEYRRPHQALAPGATAAGATRCW